MTFDYKGWGDSEGKSPHRLAPYSRVADVQAAMTFLGLQPEVNEDNIGIYGTVTAGPQCRGWGPSTSGPNASSA